MKGLNSYHKKRLLDSNFYKLDFEFNKNKKEIYFASYLANFGSFNAIDVTVDIELVQKVKEAIRFAEFVTNTNNQLVFARQANVLPSTIDGIKAYTSEQKKLQSSTPLSDAITISANQLKNTETLIPIQKNMNQLQKIIYEHLQYAMLGKKSVKQSLSDAAEDWNNFIVK